MSIMKFQILQSLVLEAGITHLTGREKNILAQDLRLIHLMVLAGNGIFPITVLTQNRLKKNGIPFEKETLTTSQKTNEYIMTALRTKEGLDLDKLSKAMSRELRAASKKFIESGKLTLKENKLVLTKEGKLFADGIAAELFVDSI